MIDKVYTEAYQPFSRTTRSACDEALERGDAPLKAFMLKQTREADLALFVEARQRAARCNGPEDVPLRVLVPAFVTSELKTAFQIGFVIFIPFLIIDMVVASVLMSMGMMMLSPVLIALPFKMMLFVLVDGWKLLIGSLAQSFCLLNDRDARHDSRKRHDDGPQALEVTLMVSAPLLLVALAVGLSSASSRPRPRSTR